MNLKNIHTAYFLGIGGIGMSALARYFMHQNVRVLGYDKTPGPLTTQLIAEGADIIFEDNAQLIPAVILSKNTLFIYTPAIPQENQIKAFIGSKNFNWYKRSQVLGMLSMSHSCVAIAGTHGKTTISSMTAHILFNSEVGCQAFLGGIVKNYNSNILVDEGSSLMVVEADEYDRSFLQLHPQTALISAMDADHLDIYGNHENMLSTFKEFAWRTQAEGTLIVHHSLRKYFNGYEKLLSYSLSRNDADFYASNIQLKEGVYHYDLHHPKGIIPGITIQMPGMINLENSIGAAALSMINGALPEEVKLAIGTFIGIKRRMEKILINESIVYYDDYAHHPEEINAAISSIKKMYPEKKLTVVFQPHLYSRTLDFADGFAESLSKADEVVLLDIYPAREKPIPGVNSQMLLSKMRIERKQLCDKNELILLLKEKQPELLLTLGAGDIDRLVEPIKLHFS
jgi:UDP-N-acetylmuramate--alanine ligase